MTDDRGRVAVERGPLVYCAEATDNAGLSTRSVLLPRHIQFQEVPASPIQNTEGDGQTFYVTKLTTAAQTVSLDAEGKLTTGETKLTLIPYYAWNHRGTTSMDVWLAQSIAALSE